MTKKLISILFLLMYQLVFSQNSSRYSFETALEVFSEKKAIKYTDADSAITVLKKAHDNFLEQGDTLKGIQALLLKADVYGHRADYANSYEAFWKAMLTADQIINDSLDIHIHMRLGEFYSFYKKEADAKRHLQNSLDIAKRLVQENKLDKAYLTENYYAFCSTYRGLNKPILAEKYLDSCFMYFKKMPNLVEKAQLEFEKSYVLAQNKNYKEALQLLRNFESWFIDNRPSYLVLYYTYWGDIHRSIGNLNQSESFYQKGLEASKKYGGHIDFTPLIHEKLTLVHLDRGNYEKAFESQNKAKELDAKFFDSRSKNNRTLLEIKDEFRLEKERQEKLIQKQRLEQLEQEEKISFLQRTILLVTLLFFLIIGYIYFKHLRNRHRVEKELIRRNKELEIQKARELLELKNKELAASALQLVEKDEFLKELKSKIRTGGENLKVSEINKILRSVSINNTNNWEEFRLRFTSINDKFYDNLTNKYPKLSQSDHKICALIKLNFSSKDMARLLGISVESVHTTRYRLRKKLNLERSTNLEDFISSL